MAANDYRGYLRNHIEMENGQPRLHAPRGAAPTHRPLLFGTLLIMGLLQIASSVAILLHLTGYLREVDFTSAPQKPVEDMSAEPIIADALKDLRRKNKCVRKGKDGGVMPLAHLPIMTSSDFSNPEQHVTMIHWDEGRGLLRKIKYHDGRILVDEEGYYYVYAKTCFRYAREHEEQNESEVQLIQYICLKKHTQSTINPIVLTKSGGTQNWNNTTYNMYCVQQGRGILLSKGDGIFVKVSKSWLLDLEPEGSFFGAFKISN
ncbi:tumor necrosis factor ligand superfamily member 11 [Chanos chanos]|uniref:Tumor necrosis factor ligand superfamily member 11 n=1 Tax=Chanos chanos TaxID=29144 RepID=A0A6J2WHC0_CHACN|nr:tumor necrosis factor ligand superfamily member 11-like [Chanos chanos]